ncbi:MAG TPA: lytic murein transglycosylase [Caulobacteraceae bacterium]|jgi:lytic murein transglycosylase|nr:lytic murein transglycosylase [Caulobacteraceae bacterium]
MRRRDLLRFAPLLLAGGAVHAQLPRADGPGDDAAQPSSTPADLLGVSGESYFRDWFNGFYARALLDGASRNVIASACSGLSPDPRVLVHDAGQPEFARPVSAYVHGAVTAGRLAQGRELRAAIAQFAAIEAQFGCPREVLLAIWAMESGFGAIQGDMDVVRSLATLAASGRRREWAEGELFAALRILESGRAPQGRLIGSWAGAMGQTQMLPSVFLADGVDADGDGRVDIWRSAPDALASAAKLLARAGWRRGEGWAKRVVLPEGFDLGLSEGPRQPQAWWEQRGVTPPADAPWQGADAGAPAVLLLPAGGGGPAFLALPNHFVIRSYNNSLAYALSVGLLADGFAGADPLAIAWPHETPLSLDDRLAAQTALKRLGYDPGAIDGVIGAAARGALRTWQRAQGLPADGYLTPGLIARLQAAT